MKKQYQVTKIDEEKLKLATKNSPKGMRQGVSDQLYAIRKSVHVYNMDYDPNKIGGHKTPDDSPMKVPETEESDFLEAVKHIGATATEIGSPVFA